jgi:two-component system NtrC family sensor kinase
MNEVDAYKIAYLREKKARHLAEKLLEGKTRELYDNVLDLQGVVSELKTTQNQLIQSEKMASLGQLTAGIAHEINNPIAYSYSNLFCLSDNINEIFRLDKMIQAHDPNTGNAEKLLEQYQTLRKEIDADYLISDTPSLIVDSIEGIERVKKIVENLKKVSYKGNDILIACSINDCINESLKVVANELKYTIDIKLELSECADILGQQSDLLQVFINLFMNASYACGTNGLLTVKTVQEKSNVIVYIKDNGKGISEENISKIFDPFYTSKPIGEGTGLGLPISYGIIQKHNGKIEVTSKVDVGTCFIITLPLATA